MTRISIFTPVVAAAFFAVSSPVAAADPLVVELSSEASRPAVNDLMRNNFV